MSLVETPFFFAGTHAQLFAILHEAATPQAKLPFVFCHAFGEEKLWAHRAFVSFARELAALGHPVLRFDCMGNGDSDGEFSAFSVETALDDIAAAIDWLKTRLSSPQVALLGLRLGATFASCVAETRNDVASLILWAPIVDCERYIQELLRINLTTQMAVFKEIRSDREALTTVLREGGTVSVDGFDITLPLFEQLSALKLANRDKTFEGHCLIVQIERSDKAPASRELEGLASRYRYADSRLVQEDPFWKEIDRFYDSASKLSATTVQWLEQL